MKNNKKGYTLLELLGVLVIIVLLILVSVQLITSNVRKAHKDAKDVQDYALIEAAKSWISSRENISLMPVSDGDCIEVTLRELKERGFIDVDIKNPDTKELLSDDITVIIKKVGNDLTYKFNNSSQVCNVLVDSTYPRWTFVSANKTQITKNDTVVIKIKSTENIKSYDLTSDKIIVKTGGQIIDNAIISSIICTGTDSITCDVFISNIDGNGPLNLVVEKDTLTNKDNINSREVPVLTDVIVDNDGPKITYVNKENNNASGIYAKADNTVTVIFDAKDKNISTDSLQASGVDVYVNGVVNNNVTKTITRTTIDSGYRYRLSLTNLTGNGNLTVKIKKDQISDALGSKNKETVFDLGIIIDNTQPEIVFSQEGSNEYLKDVSVKIDASDLNGIKEPLEYSWSTNPNTTTFENNVSNGGTATLNNASGTYYLIVRACDLTGNCKRKISNSIYYLSNTKPTITLTPNGNSVYENNKIVRIDVVSNGAALDAGTLKYAISTSTGATANREYENNSNIKLENKSGRYYIIAEACDVLGNCERKVSNVYSMDAERPKVRYVSKTNTNRTSGATKEYATKNDTVTILLEGTDNISYNDNLAASDVTVRAGSDVVSANVTITKSNVTGGKRYLITLTNVEGNGALSITLDKTKITDNAGNQAAMGTIAPGIIIDNIKPTITYGTNGNTTYLKSQSSTINVVDNYSINSSTLKYIWSNNPSTETPNVSYASNGTYTKESVTGDYYIKATACDEAGNCETVTSNVFKLDNTAPTISFNTNGNTAYQKSQSSIITVSDEHSLGNISTYKYIWTKTPSSATPSTSFTSGQTYTQNSGDGDYYIKVYACDNAGNCTTVTSNVFKLDNTAPTCTFSGENTTWTRNNITVTATCSDNIGCTANTKQWEYTSGTHSTEIVSWTISDSAGNTFECGGNTRPISVFVDKTAPSAPSCSAPSVSGSNANVNGSLASGSTDDVTAAGNIKYYYLINNSGTTPVNSNSGFTLSRAFTRSCGTSYYEYAIAEDLVGNRSAVTYCGATSDGANSYSAWSECDGECSDGIQTRTNSCALITTGLSQTCSPQSVTHPATASTYDAIPTYTTYPATASTQTGTYTVTAHSITSSGSAPFPGFEGYYQLWFDDKFVANGITYEPGVRYNRHARGYFGCHFLVVDDGAGNVVFRKGQDSAGTNEVDGLCTDELNTGAGNPEAYFGLWSTAAGGLANIGQTVTQSFTGYMTLTTYTCNPGDIKDGSTCSTISGYTCNPGDTLDGSTCYHYGCPDGGVYNGTACESTCSYDASSSSYPATKSCSNGRTLSNGNCTYYYSSNAAQCGTSRECHDFCDCPHASHSGDGHCRYDESQGISVSWFQDCEDVPKSCTKTENQYLVYSCNQGDERSNATCYHYSCPNGGTLNTITHKCEF